MRRCAVIVVGLLALVPAGAAAASEFQAAPSYPQSRLAIDVVGKPTTRSIATVEVTGANAVFDPPTGYTLDLFVQDPRVYPQCPQSYSQQLNNLINVPAAVEHIGRGLNEGTGPDPFAIRLKYQTGTTRKVVFCAYSRLITDDAAVSYLAHTLAKPKKKKKRR